MEDLLYPKKRLMQTTSSWCARAMEIIIVISLLLLLVLGTLFVIPRSNIKGKGKETHSGGVETTSRSYSKKEVSTHNTRKDCWIIIKKKVYDVTPYVEEHPGGNAILNNAGRVAVIQQRDFLDPNMARESSV
ncbi:cytochrome B5-like protein isoform X3 [Brachypodium distachyon]|uniref:cytochrome B5-like protein isoform X3 n=1 Tax=Brachypodium distachyon TaxID=15368 RepID=UPI00071C2EEA|nr:cytochrome B5-like protein isoform X3 [Brachypodium distachyon]|eukprot:XP_014758364.1 cytochrome B5-like protein isoform X3 [Brachypodium distachyon]